MPILSGELAHRASLICISLSSQLVYVTTPGPHLGHRFATLPASPEATSAGPRSWSVASLTGRTGLAKLGHCGIPPVWPVTVGDTAGDPAPLRCGRAVSSAVPEVAGGGQWAWRRARHASDGQAGATGGVRYHTAALLNTITIYFEISVKQSLSISINTIFIDVNIALSYNSPD